MENPQIIIKPQGDSITIKHANGLNDYEPLPFLAQTNIATLTSTMLHRHSYEVLNLPQVVIAIDAENARITAFENPEDRFARVINGSARTTQEFSLLLDLTQEERTPAALLKAIKKNKHLFTSPIAYQTWVNLLRNWKAKVTHSTENTTTLRGKDREARDHTVIAELPETISFTLPILTETQPVEFTYNVCYSADGENTLIWFEDGDEEIKRKEAVKFVLESAATILSQYFNIVSK